MALDEVEKPAGRGDEQIDGGVENFFALAVVIHTAVYCEVPEPRILADCVGILANLDDEFAGGSDDERTGIAAGRRPLLWRTEVAREDCDEKRGRLAAAGLRLAGDVLALESLLKRKRLDLGAILKAEIGDAVHHFRGEIEILKTLAPFLRLDDERRRVPRFVGGFARSQLRRSDFSAGTLFARSGIGLLGAVVALWTLRTVVAALLLRTLLIVVRALLILLRALGLIAFALLILLLTAIAIVLCALPLAGFILAAILVLAAAAATAILAATLAGVARVLILFPAGEYRGEFLQKTKCHVEKFEMLRKFEVRDRISEERGSHLAPRISNLEPVPN